MFGLLDRAARRILDYIRALVYTIGFRPRYRTLFYSPSRALIEMMKNRAGDFEKGLVRAGIEIGPSKYCHTCNCWMWQNGHWVNQKALLNPGERCESCGRGRPVGEERVRIEVAVADPRYCTACFKWTRFRPNMIHGLETLEFGICTTCGTPYHEN